MGLFDKDNRPQPVTAAGGVVLSLFHSVEKGGLVVRFRFVEPLQSLAQITQECVVTHRVNRVHMMPPHLLVALGEVALLIVPPGDVADVLDAQECIFVRFVAHVKGFITIFASRSTVRLVVK